MNDLGYWNKKAFKLFAEKTPEKCPQCGGSSNFRLYREKPEPPFMITDYFYLKHKCGWEKDITPWEIA